MDLQLLDGIDLQVLDGMDGRYDGPLDKAERIVRRKGRVRQHVIANATLGLTNAVAEEAENIADGIDFAGFAGNDSLADEEMIRNYLERTKEVADTAPGAVASYQNPQQLSRMIGTVLEAWDTNKREQVLDDMIAEEKRLSGLGNIDINVADDRYDKTEGDFYDVDVAMYGAQEAKRSFLTSVKKALKPNLTTEAQDIVANNPATAKAKQQWRQTVKSNRTYKTKIAADKDGKKRFITVKSATQQNKSLKGVNGDVEALLTGEDLQYGLTGEDPIVAIGRYLMRTRKVAQEHPELFASAEQAAQTSQAIGTLLSVWNNAAMRDRVFRQIESTQGLDGFIKKAVKKVAAAVKKVAKKVGKAVVKVTKKVVKLTIRFNPLTLLIRAGILGFVRLNMFKVANKCYPGSLAKADALKQGVTADYWEKSNKAYGHLKNAYTKLGGKESKLKSTLAKGNKKKWEGTEYPTDGNAIKTAANKLTAADQKEAQGDMDYDETLKEYNSKGYVSDSTVSSEVATVNKNVEVTIVENERTAKNATNLYEGDDAAKSLITVPKGAKVLVDTKETSGNYIAATYNGKNGWVKTSDLAGLGWCDAESVAVIGVGALYDMQGDGLGEPATATAIAAASATIASVMAKIKDIFSAVQNVAQKVQAAKQTVTAVKETAQAAKSGNVTAAVNSATKAATTAAKATGSNAVAQAASKASAATTAAKTAVNTAKTTVATAVNTAKTTATNAVSSVTDQVKKAQADAQAAVKKAQDEATAKIKKAQDDANAKIKAAQDAANKAKATAEANAKAAISKAETQAKNLQTQLTNAKKDAEAKAKSLTDQLNAAKANVQTQINNATKTLTAAKTAAENSVKNLQTQLANAKKDAEAKIKAAQQAAQTNANNLIAAANKAKTAAETNVKNLQTQLTNAKKDAEAKAKSLTDQLNTAKKNAETQVKNLQTQLTNAKKDAEAKAKSLTDQLNKAKKDAETKIAAANKALADAKKDAEAKAKAQAETAKKQQAETEENAKTSVMAMQKAADNAISQATKEKEELDANAKTSMMAMQKAADAEMTAKEKQVVTAQKAAEEANEKAENAQSWMKRMAIGVAAIAATIGVVKLIKK